MTFGVQLLTTFWLHLPGFFGTPVPSGTPPNEFSLNESLDEKKEDKPSRFPISSFVLDGCLRLSLEEAFYLSFALRLLSIKINGEIRDLLELWQTFCRADPEFVSQYVVYHNFRSKNWVVRSGLKLGSEFLLYKDGPTYYHASYVVKVHEITDKSQETSAFKSWPEMACLNRVVNQVVKGHQSSAKLDCPSHFVYNQTPEDNPFQYTELIVCYVVWPNQLTKEQVYKSPRCLSKFTLQEVLVRRWVAAEDRGMEDY